MDDPIEHQFGEILESQRDLRERLCEVDDKIERLCRQFATGARGEGDVPTPKPESEPVKVRADKGALRLAVAKTRPAPAEDAKAAAAKVAPEPAEGAGEPAADAVADGGGAELRLGRFWLVRAGVVMLLAGLVFFAEYARSNWWTHLTPALKVASLYFGSFGLLAIGLWLERRREDTRHFGRVLAAGGAAAVYYTTYAAHYVAGLRVIGDPVVAAALLLVWAAALVFDSGRRGSQGMAVAGLLLAYFTCVIGEVTPFAYWSALVLTAGGAALVLRRGWLAVSYVGMAASYLCFAYWRSPGLLAWAQGAPPDASWFGSAYAFLLGYWVVFTVAALWPRSAYSDRARCTFVTLNNGAFMALFSLGIARHAPDLLGEFWLLAGVVLGGLGLVGKRLLADSRAPALYTASGVLVFTAGLFAQFEGAGLSLALTLESASLAVASRLLPGRRGLLGTAALALAMASLVSALSAGTPQALVFGQSALWLAATALMRWGRSSEIGSGESERQFADDLPAAFALLAAAAFSAGILAGGISEWRSLGWFAGAVVAYGFGTRIKYPALQTGAAFYGLGAAGLILIDWVDSDSLMPGSAPFVLLAVGFALAAKVCARRLGPISDLYSIGAVGLSAVAIGLEFDLAATVTVPAIVAALWYGYAQLFKLPRLAFAALWLGALAICASAAQYLLGANAGGESFWLVVELVGLWALVRVWPASQSPRWRKAAETCAVVFAGLAFLLWSGGEFDWVGSALVRIGVAAGLLALAAARRERAMVWPALALMLVGQSDWMVAFVQSWNSVTPLALPLLIAVPVWAGRVLTRDGWCGRRGGEVSWLFGAVAAAMVFALATKWGSGALSMPGAWAFAGAALFGLGLVLGEKVYRVFALGLLALATAHVLTIDVWALGTLGRVASFGTVGVVLVLLGFFYNRFSERLKRAG